MSFTVWAIFSNFGFRMGYKNKKYIPYKISCVSFVPHMQYNVDQLQIVVSSRMEKSDESNKLAVFRINPESIDNHCHVDVDSRITDMGWVSLKWGHISANIKTFS